MRRDAQPKQLTRSELEKRLSLKTGGILGFADEPRTTVIGTIEDVFYTRRSAGLVRLAGESDRRLRGQREPITPSLRRRLREADNTLPEHERIREFKPEVLKELLLARLQGTHNAGTIAIVCASIVSDLHSVGFDDRRIVALENPLI